MWSYGSSSAIKHSTSCCKTRRMPSAHGTLLLRVPDAEVERAFFRSRGIGIEETTPIPGADRFFIRDPDGNRIEIIQWKRPYDPAENAV